MEVYIYAFFYFPYLKQLNGCVSEPPWQVEHFILIVHVSVL